jgi:hypothetical protein
MDTAFGMRLRRSDGPGQAQNDAMKTLALTLVFACAGALAQTAVPGAAPLAPRPAKPAPRLMTPARLSARVASASAGAIHDATARCKALESESERAKCLTRIARERR